MQVGPCSPVVTCTGAPRIAEASFLGTRLHGSTGPAPVGLTSSFSSPSGCRASLGALVVEEIRSEDLTMCSLDAVLPAVCDPDSPQAASSAVATTARTSAKIELRTLDIGELESLMA